MAREFYPSAFKGERPGFTYRASGARGAGYYTSDIDRNFGPAHAAELAAFKRRTAAARRIQRAFRAARTTEARAARADQSDIANYVTQDTLGEVRAAKRKVVAVGSGFQAANSLGDWIRSGTNASRREIRYKYLSDPARVPLARHQAARALLAQSANNRPAKRQRVNDSYRATWTRLKPDRDIAATFPREVGQLTPARPGRGGSTRPLAIRVPARTNFDHAAAVQLDAELNPGRGRGGRGGRGGRAARGGARGGRGSRGRGSRGRGRGRA
jgi:hypothetical protein